MRKIIVLLLLMSVTMGYAQQKRKVVNRRSISTQKKITQVQNCEVSGVVTYFHNKFLGNRPDVGATVKLIKVEDLDSTKFNHTVYSYYKCRQRLIGQLEESMILKKPIGIIMTLYVILWEQYNYNLL